MGGCWDHFSSHGGAKGNESELRSMPFLSEVENGMQNQEGARET